MSELMTPRQYQAAKHELGWRDIDVAQIIDKNVATLYRWLRQPKLPKEFAILMRTFMRLRFTMGKNRFDEFIKEITKESA